MDNIIQFLFDNQDAKYREFQSKLIPTISPESIIGVRTPILQKKAKEMVKDGSYKAFISKLPHKYYDENQLHGFILSQIKDFDECIEQMELFLPYIDNWSTCDQTSSRTFKKNTDKLYPFILKWLKSEHLYTKRFAIHALMQYYLDEHFAPEQMELVSKEDCEEYYLNMGIAWYFSFALVKQWDSAIKIIESKRLSPFTQNKSIQKSIESYRISDDKKNYLRTLKL